MSLVKPVLKRVTMANIKNDTEPEIKIEEEQTLKRPNLQWQLSTTVSASRANLMPVIAEKYRTIISDLGEDTSRAGLVDTPRRAAQALLFFTKGYEDR